MIQLNGNYGEGGGSLVRVALALSALTGQNFKVTNIRAGRQQGGLKAQHLQAIKALKKICQAETNDVEIGSTELYFQPGKVQAGVYEIDIGTAGSITLLLQALILPCLFAPRKITLNVKGGTCGKWQASVDYLKNILLPQLARFVEKIELKILKRGYYPKGGGEIKLEIYPRFFRHESADFKAFWTDLSARCPQIMLVEQGQVEQIKGSINLSQELQEKKVAERIRQAVLQELRKYKLLPTIRIEYVNSSSPGGEVLLWATGSGRKDESNPVLLAGDALLERGKRSEEVGKEAAAKLIQEIDSGAAVDHYLADQLIPFLALLPGSEILTSKVSNHTLTNIYVVEKFLPVKFTVEGRKIRSE